MYFNLSKKKILSMIILFGVLLVVIAVSLYVERRLHLDDAFRLHSRRLGENLSYWWSNKVFNNGGAQAANYKNDGTKARSIPVLVYHGLPEGGNGGDNLFDPKYFSEHMRTLNDAGWRTITLDEFEGFIRGQIELPERSFLLTFDDGRKDTFYPADPVLRDLDMHAIMFAITKRSTSPTAEQSTYYLSKYELLAVEESEHWEVESHGRDSHDWYYISDDESIGHFFSNLLWLPEQNRVETSEEFRTRIAYDLSNSKIDLETALGKEIRTFAYPFSDYGQDGFNYKEAQRVVAEEVSKFYKFAFYQTWDGNGETFNYPNAKQVMMKRIEPRGEWSGEHLAMILESGLSKDLPYGQTSFGEEWIGSWGKVSKGDDITLAATDTSTGASSALNGSWWWRDYRFSTDTRISSGSNVVLVARRGDDENYFGCNFERDKVYVKTVRNGDSYNLTSADYAVPYNQNVNLVIEVDGNNIRCLVNGNVVVAATGVNQRIINGGIGLEIWDPEVNVAKSSFDNIKVSAIAN